jgi:hypothetical protein
MNFIFKVQFRKILLAFLNFVIYSIGWVYFKIGIELGRGFYRLFKHNF